MLRSSNGSFYSYRVQRWLDPVPLAHVRDWWRQTQAIQEGRRLARDGGALAAAMGMRYLNWHTEGGLERQKQDIYHLKRVLINLFYCQQFPVHVSRQIQTLRCDRCCGTGIFYSRMWGEDLCWHCNGTGVYRENALLRFAFTIDGDEFVWHQPANLVSPLIYVNKGEPTSFEGQKQARAGFNWTAAHVALGAVLEYLQQHRDVRVRLPGLIHALAADLAPLQHRVHAWRAGVRAALEQAHYLPSRDDIPF